jgi:hypothetical protein
MASRSPTIRKRLILALAGAAAAGLSLASGNAIIGPIGISAALTVIILALGSLSEQILRQNNRRSADISKIWESQQMDNDRLTALESASALCSNLIEKLERLQKQVVGLSDIDHINNKIEKIERLTEKVADLSKISDLNNNSDTPLKFEQLTERQELLLDLLTTIRVEVGDVKTRIERLCAANKTS